jgi:hypothetical protein
VGRDGRDGASGPVGPQGPQGVLMFRPGVYAFYSSGGKGPVGRQKNSFPIPVVCITILVPSHDGDVG